MERKLVDAKKVVKKHVKESGLLSEKIETLEHSNKLLKEKNYKLQNEKKLYEPHNDFHSVSSKITKADLSVCSSSLESSIFKSVPDINLQATKSRFLQVSSTSYSDSRKPFPPSAVAQELLTFKPFPTLENMVPGKPFPPIGTVNPAPGKPFAISQDGNNNPDNNRHAENNRRDESVAVDREICEHYG